MVTDEGKHSYRAVALVVTAFISGVWMTIRQTTQVVYRCLASPRFSTSQTGASKSFSTSQTGATKTAYASPCRNMGQANTCLTYFTDTCLTYFTDTCLTYMSQHGASKSGFGFAVMSVMCGEARRFTYFTDTCLTYFTDTCFTYFTDTCVVSPPLLNTS